MKIIKRGIDPADVALNATCSKCKSEIEFLPVEGKFSSSQRDGSYFTITCPVCGTLIYKNASR